jgi:hypothetical protein
VALFIVGFTYTAAWRLHAERGQSYVLLAFLLAWWLTRMLDPKRGNGFVAGLLAGFLIALRPPFALVLPFLVLHRRGQLLGAGVGILLGFGLPLLINPASWSDYFSAMQTHSELYRNDIDPLPGQQTYPAKIEGIPTDILGNYVAIPYADFSMYALLKNLGVSRNPLTNEAVPGWPLLLLVALPFAFWLWISRKQSPENLLMGLAAWLFLADFFLPAYRDSYNDVVILDVVFLSLIAATQFPWPVWPGAFALPIGWIVYVFAPEQNWLINLPTALFALSAILIAASSTFLFNNRAGSRKVTVQC